MPSIPTGYKSGGFNPRPLTRTQVTSFGPGESNLL